MAHIHVQLNSIRACANCLWADAHGHSLKINFKMRKKSHEKCLVVVLNS